VLERGPRSRPARAPRRAVSRAAKAIIAAAEQAGCPLKARGKLVGVNERQLLLDAQTAVADIAPDIQP
jgi:hypothetical protein